MSFLIQRIKSKVDQLESVELFNENLKYLFNNPIENLEKEANSQKHNLLPEKCNSKEQAESFESDEDGLETEEVQKVNPQTNGTDLKFSLEEAFSSLPSRWRNYVIRAIFGALMIGGFIFICYLGPMCMFGLILLIEAKGFHEVISIGHTLYKAHKLPLFQALSWYLLFVSNYYFFGEKIYNAFGEGLEHIVTVQVLIQYHKLISFALYMASFIWFVLSLVKKHYFKQFSLFAWTHVTMIVFSSSIFFVMECLQQGLIWVIFPITLSVLNDIMAHQFGFFFGKTPLIKLSPKKTWEGFIGAAVSTLVIGLLLAHFYCQYQFLVCPVELSNFNSFPSECVPSYIFTPTKYELPYQGLQSMLSTFHIDYIETYPFIFHASFLALFSSIIGPFGGFFASGFKRAFKIKDFGSTIPGHGGVMDRLDCTLLMQIFVYVYIHSFIRTSPDPKKLLFNILLLRREDQLNIYQSLKSTIKNRIGFI